MAKAITAVVAPSFTKADTFAAAPSFTLVVVVIADILSNADVTAKAVANNAVTDGAIVAVIVAFAFDVAIPNVMTNIANAYNM